MTLVSGNIRFMRIFEGVHWRGGVKQQWGCRKRQFSVVFLAISSEALQVRHTIIIIYSSIFFSVASPVAPKYVTLNDPEWPFYVKFSFWQVQVQDLLYTDSAMISIEVLSQIFYLYICYTN